jgi:hypothetical protein
MATEQVETPAFIAEPRDVVFGDEDGEKAIVLQQVSQESSDRVPMMAQRWSEEGKSTQDVVEGLAKIKMVENMMKDE